MGEGGAVTGGAIAGTAGAVVIIIACVVCLLSGVSKLWGQRKGRNLMELFIGILLVVLGIMLPISYL